MMDCGEDAFLCHQCGKMFYRLSTLESHTKWKHSEKTNEFMCDQCGRTFQKKYNLLKHLESGIHDVSETVKCAICDFRAQNRKIMGEHYQQFHGILLKETNEYFKTVEEFYKWKSEFENQTKSRFVKMSSSRKRKNGLIRSTYFCHRDGNFIPKGRNLRHLKVKGSNKINAHCPAKMDVDIGERIVIVSYVNTHLGHDMDVTRMSLDHLDRAVIANKLARRVPFEQILDEINSPQKKSDLKRVNYLTRKDLWNIVDTFKLNPKSIVYSKTRTKRKRKTEKPKKESKKLRMCYKPPNKKSNNTDGNGLMISDVEGMEYTDGQIIAVNQGDEENIIFCPVIKEENEECFQEYALISDDTSTGDGGTYYIINAEGELESISGHQVIYTEDGEVALCESGEIESDELTESNQSILLVPETMTDDVRELVTLGEDGCETSLKRDLHQIKTSSATVEDNSPVNSSLDSPIGDENEAVLAEEEVHIDDRSENNLTMQVLTTENENYCNSDFQLKEQSSNHEVRNQLIGEELEVVNNPEYEVTIENYDGESNEFVIISSDGHFEECAVISNTVNTEPEFDQIDYPLTELEHVTVKEENVEELPIKEEVVDTYVNDQVECIAVLEEEPQWNEKRKKVLDKLLNVHRMINNEQQLNIFSKKISSLEHVLKTLSQSDQSAEYSGSEYTCDKSKNKVNPNNHCS